VGCKSGAPVVGAVVAKQFLQCWLKEVGKGSFSMDSFAPLFLFGALKQLLQFMGKTGFKSSWVEF
jgi:hypothetical protein